MKHLSILFSLFFISILSFSQTGPGGVGNSSSNVIWLDAAYASYSTYPNISSLLDQSGNGNDFSQLTSSKEPRLVTYGPIKAARFRGDYLTSGAISDLNTNTISKYCVFEGGEPDHVGIVMDLGYSQSLQFFRTMRANSNIRSWVFNDPSGLSDNITGISSSFQILSSVWDGAGAETFTSYKDGSSIGTETGANGNPSGNSINSVGAAINGAYPLQADVSEIIVYNTLINSAQRKIVDNYLSSKFGVSISNDVYSYDALHGNEVIGIGQESDGGNLTAQGKGIVELSAGLLSNGSYLLTGHDNTNLSSTTNDVPGTLPGGSRAGRVWRADITGSVGNVNVKYDISSLSLPVGDYYLLVESDNGVFNDGGVVSYGPFADVAGIVTFNNVAFASGDYFSIASASSSVITSITSGYWDVASTWSCSCVPGLTDSVVINTGHTVTARTSTNIEDVIVTGTLSTIQTSVFNVYGDYTVDASGSAVHNKITFMGATNQKVTNNSGSTIDFSTLVIDNSANVGLYAGGFEISSSVKVTTGQLQNISATCTLRSTATKTGIILPSTTGNGFSGQFVVQRYISSRNASWGDLSSPVASSTLGELDSDNSGTVTELFMSHVGGIDGDAGDFFSAWEYDAVNQKYDSIIDTSYVFSPGKGIEVWLGDDFTTFNAKVIDTRGTPNYGDVNVSLSDSWNLVGNPYQAFVDWGLLTKPTLNSTYYIWNTNNASYDAHTNGVIPPHQGFWVESVGTGTLTFSETSKNGSAATIFYKTGANQNDNEPYEFTEAILKVKSNRYQYNHSLKLRMNNLANEELDNFDASFKSSRIIEAPSITSYAKQSNKELAINSFNYQEEVIIPITVKVGVSGNHILEPINFNNFENDFKFIELKDNKTGKVYNLKNKFKGGGISFDINVGDNPDRFTLRLTNLLAQSSETLNDNVNVYKTAKNTIVELDNTDEQYVISVFNSVGQKVIEDILTDSDNKILIDNDKLPHGINLITIKSDKGIVVKKMNY